MNLAFMESSHTFTLSGNSSILEAQFFPPIELSPNKNYVLGLVELLTFNSIPNIDIGQNKFYVGKEASITIPTGSYELTDIANFLKKELKQKSITINLKPNNNTLKSEIKCSEPIDFTSKDSIGRILGFTPQILSKDVLHTSDQPVTILKVNAIRIECNITTGAYINNQKVHTIHEFFPAVPPGFKIIEVPTQVIYLPISVKRIDHLQIRIIDQDGNLINFRGEEITVRLHIKQVI